MGIVDAVFKSSSPLFKRGEKTGNDLGNRPLASLAFLNWPDSQNHLTTAEKALYNHPATSSPLKEWQ
jgi:hypothetical protein